jgi:hypothetical protein
MRKYTPPTETLVGDPQFLATMNFVESALYPVADPTVARAVGTVSDVNYRTVYETVFFGNGRIPGLYSQTVRPPDDMDFSPGFARTPSADLGSAEIEINLNIQQWLDDWLKRSNRREDAREFNEAIAKASSEAMKSIGETPGAAKRAAEAAYRVLRDELDFPLPTRGEAKNAFNSTIGRVFQTRRETQEFGTGIGPAEAQRMREEAAFRGEDVSRAVPSGREAETAPAGSPATQVQPTGPGRAAVPGSEPARIGYIGQTTPYVPARITDLANALTRQVRHQNFDNIPLGYTPDDFLQTSNPRLAELQIQSQRILGQLGAATSDDERSRLIAQSELLLDEINTEMQQGGTSFIARPGRGPTSPLDRTVIDYTRRMQADPTKYTLDAMRFDARMIAEMRKYPGAEIETEKYLSASDVQPTLRDLGVQNKLPDLYQRLAAVMPSFSMDRVMDINGVDDYAIDQFAQFTANAQRNNMTWDEYLAQLENDPEHLSRVAQTRRRAGGSAPAIRLPSDDDLTQVFKYVSQATIGRTLPKDVYQGMIDAYKPQLVRFQQQLQGGGQVTEPPQAETFAETQIEQQFGQEAFTYQLGGFLNELSKLAGGGM